MTLIGRKKEKLNFFIKIFVFIFVLYSAFSVVNQQAQISRKKRELCEINSNLVSQQLKNKELKEIVELAQEKDGKYIERVARDVLGFVKQNEHIFINIAGD